MTPGALKGGGVVNRLILLRYSAGPMITESVRGSGSLEGLLIVHDRAHGRLVTQAICVLRNAIWSLAILDASCVMGKGPQGYQDYGSVVGSWSPRPRKARQTKVTYNSQRAGSVPAEVLYRPLSLSTAKAIEGCERGLGIPRQRTGQIRK